MTSPAPGNEFVASEAYLASADGTELHADVFRPANLGVEEPTPVILSSGPYNNHAGFFEYVDRDHQGSMMKWRDLWERARIFERGYTWVELDLRGYGGSAGCCDAGGSGEQADVKAGVEWAAAQPWSTGRVGVFGKSYEAWTTVMALATNPVGLAAAVVLSPLISAYRTLYHNGVPYSYLTEAALQTIGLDALAPSRRDDPRYQRNALLGMAYNVPRYVELLASLTTKPDADDPWWRERDLIERAGNSEVPVLWSHGFLDVQCKPDNFLPVFGALRGPKRAWFGHFAHDTATSGELLGRDGFLAETVRFLDRFVKGVPEAQARVEDDPRIVVQDNRGGWRAEDTWPPPDVTVTRMAVRPGSFVDEPGNGADATGLTGRVGVGTWSLSAPLAHDCHLAGEPEIEVSVQVAPAVDRAHLFAVLYDVDRAGRAVTITRGAHVVRAAGSVRFRLFATDWRLDAGHRIALLLSGSEDCYWLPPHSLATITVTAGSVGLPWLCGLRAAGLDGGPSVALRGRPEPFVLPAEVLTSAPDDLAGPPRLVMSRL